VPSKTRPDDWDRLFAPNARRRGGPLRTLVTIIVAALLIALLGTGVTFALEFREQRFAQAVASATAVAPTQAAIRTATAQVKLNATATIAAAFTATAVAKLPTATPEGILTATVFNGGNVRAAPVNGDPLDQINAGETVQLVGKNAGGSWFKVSYGRNGQTITGWVSKTLLTIDPSIEQQVPVGQ
jgi:Tfp pilus assembly protein PilX